ncbi:MAG: hypothetical protein H6934_10370 [Burkholderiaceae bacterium]|nr:hypothetical protein [Burkholderiaceae bacterium]
MTQSGPTFEPIPRIVLEGTARERGRSYGEQAAARIAVSMDVYRQTFETCDMSWARVCERARPYEAEIERVFPVALEELRGVAEGCGTDFASLLALNVRTELLPSDFLAKAGAPGQGAANECTSFAVSGDGAPVWLAQNWDWIGLQRPALVLLDVRPDAGARQLVMSEAGMLAKAGFNEHGLGITLNILRSVRDGEAPGLPTHILLRALLECTCVEEAIEFARRCTFAASSNVLVADAQGAIASLEFSPLGVRVVAPVVSGGRRRLWHTNHFLDPDQTAVEANLDGNLSTRSRLEVAGQMLGDATDLDAAIALLSDTRYGLESICRFPDPTLPPIAQIETVASIIMDLQGRHMWLSPAQPTVSSYAPHDLAAVSVTA